MNDALEASFMISKVPYDEVVNQIAELRQKKKEFKLTLTEKEELKRLVSLRITRDYRTRKKMKN